MTKCTKVKAFQSDNFICIMHNDYAVTEGICQTDGILNVSNAFAMGSLIRTVL